MSENIRLRGWINMDSVHRQQFLWTWSASKLGALECLTDFYFRYIFPMPVPEGIDKIFGKAIHAMAERFFRLNYKSKKTYLNAWWGYWNKHVAKRNPPALVRCDAEYDDAWDMHFKIGMGILSRFWDENIELKGTELAPEVEKRVDFRFGPFRLIGYIDRRQPTLTGGVEIHDYKTGRGQFTQARLIRDRQFTIYSLSEVRLHGKPPEAMYVHKLGSSNFEKINVPLRDDTDYEVLFTEISRAHTLLKRLLTDAPNPRDLPIRFGIPEDFVQHVFPPSPGARCNWCDFSDQCHEMRGDTVDPFRKRLVSAELGRFAREEIENTPKQHAFLFQFKKKKVHFFTAKKDTKVAKHKRKAAKGDTQLSWSLR